MIDRPVNQEENPLPMTDAEWAEYRKECES